MKTNNMIEVTFTCQQTFTLVRNHLLKQGKKAIDDGGNCRYLAPDGSKCAAGCLIPDGKYDQAFERKEVPTIVRQNGFSDWFGHNPRLVLLLQYIHDCERPSAWDQRLSDLAKEWGVLVEVS